MERVSAIADTGFIVALANHADVRHVSVRNSYLQQEKILLPQTVLTEVAYLLGRERGGSLVVAFLRGVAESKFQLEALTDEDINLTTKILDEYKDSRIDFVDATVMSVAERYQISRILTIDRRDFSIFRPSFCSYFEILP